MLKCWKRSRATPREALERGSGLNLPADFFPLTVGWICGCIPTESNNPSAASLRQQPGSKSGTSYRHRASNKSLVIKFLVAFYLSAVPTPSAASAAAAHPSLTAAPTPTTCTQKSQTRFNGPNRKILQLRGGATINQKTSTPDTTTKSSKTKKKDKKKRPTKKASKKKVPELFQLPPIPTTESSSTSARPTIQVQSLLTDRYISWKWLARFVLGSITFLLLQACVATAGIPRREAIFDILLKNRLLSNPSYSSVALMAMPTDFKPTALETFLATTLAKVSPNSIMIPPAAMPSAELAICTMISSLAFIFITILLPHWLLKVNIWYDYHRQPIMNYDSATDKDTKPTAVLIEIMDNQKHSTKAICQLKYTPLRSQMEHNLPPYYFEHQHRRYFFDPNSPLKYCWEGGPNWTQQTVGQIMSQAQKKSTKKHVGLLQSPSDLAHAQERWYPYNHQTSVPIPTLSQALWERVQSPLVVAQFIGKALAVLEEGKGALVAFGMTLFQHYRNAQANIQSSIRLQQDVAGLAEEFARCPIWIFRRGAGWRLMETTDLLPGDLFWITSNQNTQNQHIVVPVDALLLEGLCVTMEAVLTGESVPQTKMPIDSETPQWNQTLDMAGAHRNAILFAGTTLLHCTSSTASLKVDASSSIKSETSKGGLPPGHGALCLALKTGSYSSKGELIGALTSSRAKSGAATISNPQFDKDALKLISIMSLVSVLACASLFWDTASHRKVSGFRRIIQCTRIATACIPSDLPMSLSHIVQSCAHVLRQEADVVCSQPGALLSSAQVDTVVFDKTGTLTADTQSLSQVVTYPGKKEEKTPTSKPSKPKKKSSAMANLVLAGCHSIASVPDTNGSGDGPSSSLVGDPLELAALRFSGWQHNPDLDFYYPKTMGAESHSEDVEKLWQLKVFPFNPSARLSSALCLARHYNGEYKLWAVIKGAPEAVSPLLNDKNHGGQLFTKWYNRRVQKLEAKGVRAIAMAANEMNTVNGTDILGVAGPESSVISRARQYADTLHRSDLEERKASLSFCGLACFNAQVRPSSRRILKELSAGNIHSIMLTGDSQAAALAVAQRVGMIGEVPNLAALEVASSTPGGKAAPKLQWRTIKISKAKQKGAVVEVTLASVEDILQKARRGEVQLVASGNAIMELLDRKGGDDGLDLLIDNLHCFSVVARASPDCKERFVGSLKGRVLMCGDGVNDVKAMKMAEVSVALLNGFGTEADDLNEKGKDTEDERRKQRLKTKGLGSRRPTSQSSSSLDEQGIGTTRAAAASRMQKRLAQANLEISERAIKRSADGGEPQYTLTDIKDTFNAFWSAIMEERRRSKTLKQGGGEAASILAEEDIAMRKSLGADTNSTQLNVEIKPGEACMASPFSCLRSSIDGVESVIRAGIATAACALSVQQKITLHSMITCFNLSALFRDGFRYGKNMSMVDYMLYMLVDSASYQESCKMRPRLPRTKRPSAQSLFAPPNFFSVIGQVLVHLLSTELGMQFARRLEKQSTEAESARNLLIRATGSQSTHMAALSSTLIKLHSITSDSTDDMQEGPRFLRRPKFVPNYETNVVFVLSLLQSVVTTLLLHKGKPFCPSILESRLLCTYGGLSCIFVAACILENVPSLNQMLELRPWQSKRAKFFVLALALSDTLACLAIEYTSRWCFQSSSSVKTPHQSTSSLIGKADVRRSTTTAADLEEGLLRDETKRNSQVVFICASAVALMALGAMVG